MVKIKALKKHKFASKILKLTWDIMEGASTTSNYSVKITQLLTNLKLHLYAQFDDVDIDKITISSGFKGISLFLLTPQLNIIPIPEKDIYGYIYGMRVVMDEDSDSNIMEFKYENKLVGEIKILNYE